MSAWKHHWAAPSPPNLQRKTTLCLLHSMTPLIDCAQHKSTLRLFCFYPFSRTRLVRVRPNRIRTFRRWNRRKNNKKYFQSYGKSGFYPDEHSQHLFAIISKRTDSAVLVEWSSWVMCVPRTKFCVYDDELTGDGNGGEKCYLQYAEQGDSKHYCS